MAKRYIKRLFGSIAILTAVTLLLTGCFSQLIGSLISEVSDHINSGDQVSSSELADDYYQAINGQWISQATIGSGVPSIDSFSEVSMQTTTDLLGILMDLGDKAQVYSQGSDERLLADFYNSAMDYESRDKDGLAPILPFIDAISSARNLAQLTDALALMDNSGIGSLVTWNVSADLYDSATNVLYISVAYVGLPQKEYYHDTDSQTIAVRSAYIKYLIRLFEQLPQYAGNAKQAAQNVLDFETEMTEAYWSAEEWNTVSNIYNPMTLDQIATQMGRFDARRFYTQTGISDAQTYIVSCPQYLSRVGELYTEGNLERLKQYAVAMVLSQAGRYLTGELEAVQTEYDNAINGSTGSLLDIEQAYNTVNNYMGELLSRIYAEQLFGEDAKAEVEQMARLIISTYEQRIRALDWMSEPTKEKAIKKLDTMTIKIGYPDTWNDYSNIDIRSYDNGGSLYGNIMKLYARLCEESIAKIGKPVDRAEWQMFSHTVNAYYSPTANEIVFPAAILQPPFFDADAPFEENLGGIGSVIAHEVSHAFDDTGALFDEAGNYTDWWTQEDLTAYQDKTYRLVRQFEEIEVSPGQYINGTLTLGENIADLGGLTCVVQIAKDQGGDLDALFRAYARAWRSKTTPEYTSYLLKTDSHSPDKYRVNQILKNIDEFYEVYDIKEGDAMHLSADERVRIW